VQTSFTAGSRPTREVDGVSGRNRPDGRPLTQKLVLGLVQGSEKLTNIPHRRVHAFRPSFATLLARGDGT